MKKNDPKNMAPFQEPTKIYLPLSNTYLRISTVVIQRGNIAGGHTEKALFPEHHP